MNTYTVECNTPITSFRKDFDTLDQAFNEFASTAQNLLYNHSVVAEGNADNMPNYFFYRDLYQNPDHVNIGFLKVYKRA